jgi:hypothetical protein
VEEREATLDEVYGWFREDVAACFAFLETQYDFRHVSTRDEGRDGIFMRFRNNTTAVEVAYEPADDTIEVFLRSSSTTSASPPTHGSARRSSARRAAFQ